MIELTQSDGTSLQISTRPQRIVSLVPSVTETLIRFGTHPVARTSFCVWPRDEVKMIPRIGGTKTPKLKRILDAKPDLVIANQEENRKEDVTALQRLGIPVWVTYPRTVSESLSFMREAARLTGESKASLQVLRDTEATLRKIRRSRKPTPKVLVLVWPDPWMGAGSDTYIGDMVSVAGAENVLPDAEDRYPKITEEEVLDLAPDVLILPTEPYEFGPEDLDEWRRRFRQKRRFVRVSLFPGEDLIWFGPRMQEGLRALSSLFSL